MRRLLRRGAEWEPRFLEGTPRELEELFGGALPALPGRGSRFLVELHPGPRQTLRDLLEALISRRVARGAELDATGCERALARFEEALDAVLDTILRQERRLGLLNLFWLAHSREACELFQEAFARPGLPAGLKYRIHPLVQGAYRNVLTRLWTRGRMAEPLQQRALGEEFNTSLIDTIVDDQLPLTEPGIAQLNFAQALVEDNRRFRLSFPEFREMLATARERLREARERREPRLLELVRRRLPGVRPEQLEDERLLPRVLFDGRILPLLLAGGPGRNQPKDDGKGRSWAERVAEAVEFTQAVKRTEVVDRLRRWVQQPSPGEDVRAAYDEGRLYRFRPGADVVSLARKITILFADLRGFTKTAEGAVSERELTDQLYRLFDPIAGIVERYGGRIDKFTGDGVMITFGFDGVGPQDEANGLRAALAIQARVQDLRAEGRTDFEMGISVHTGRAQIAHFILNDREMDHTVIGRSANLAGRLSGSGKLDGEVEEAAARSAEGEVRVDPAGTLYNSGVAVSQDTVEALAAAGEVEAWHQGQRRGFLFADAELGKKLLLEYVGDAKFRGVGRAIAIYRLGPEGASQPRGAQ